MLLAVGLFTILRYLILLLTKLFCTIIIRPNCLIKRNKWLEAQYGIISSKLQLKRPSIISAKVKAVSIKIKVGLSSYAGLYSVGRSSKIKPIQLKTRTLLKYNKHKFKNLQLCIFLSYIVYLLKQLKFIIFRIQATQIYINNT